MKIICDSCGAKYSIADDKIAGRVFKIRCKRCTELIFVSGAAGADALWYVVIGGEQRGPLTAKQVEELVVEGQLTGESYCWRDGFADWSYIRDIDRLRRFVEPEESVRGCGDDTGVDLFSPIDEESRRCPESPTEPAATSPTGTDASSMTGTRNESSVLFSIASLRALSRNSSDGPTVEHTPATSAENGETSGLIDIRALAAAAHVQTERDNEDDDVLALGSLPLSLPASAPLLTAGEGHQRSGRVQHAVVATGAGVALTIAIAIVVLVITTDRPTEAANATQVSTSSILAGQPAVVAATQSSQVGPSQEATSPSTSPTSPVDIVDVGDYPGEADHGETRSSGSSPETKNRGSRARRHDLNRTGEDGESKVASSTPSPESSEVAPRRRSGSPGLNDLINEAIDDSTSPSVESPRPRARDGNGGGVDDDGARMPQRLSPSQVRSGMNAVAGRVRRCGNGRQGTVMVTVIIDGRTGRVSSANTSGTFAGSPVGACAVRAVRGARFPRFRQSTLSVRYPFPIQ